MAKPGEKALLNNKLSPYFIHSSEGFQTKRAENINGHYHQILKGYPALKRLPLET